MLDWIRCLPSLQLGRNIAEDPWSRAAVDSLLMDFPRPLRPLPSKIQALVDQSARLLEFPDLAQDHSEDSEISHLPFGQDEPSTMQEVRFFAISDMRACLDHNSQGSPLTDTAQMHALSPCKNLNTPCHRHKKSSWQSSIFNIQFQPKTSVQAGPLEMLYIGRMAVSSTMLSLQSVGQDRACTLAKQHACI